MNGSPFLGRISTGVCNWGEIVGLAFGAIIVAAVIVLTALGVIS